MSELKNFWLVVGTVVHTKDGVNYAETASGIFATDDDKFTAAALNVAHQNIAASVVEEKQIPGDAIKSIMITNVSPLGRMTREEMFGKQPVVDEPAK